jgi:flagellar hook protein FlgE
MGNHPGDMILASSQHQGHQSGMTPNTIMTSDIGIQGTGLVMTEGGKSRGQGSGMMLAG